MLEKKIVAREIMYGVNTGIGEFSEIVLTDEQVQQFQRYLIYNHAAGIGKPCPIDHVRAAMLSRINVHAHGHSGCRPEITQTYVAMLNKGVTPVVCEKGSVGACGDLAPMSQLALCLMGEGEVVLPGRAHADPESPWRRPASRSRASRRATGWPPSTAATSSPASACLTLFDAERWIAQAEIAAAMTLEALLANMKPYDGRLHQLRGFRGAVTCAKNLRAVMAGSDLVTGKLKVKVQDAYSMRSTPQVIGSLRDLLA